MMRHLICLFIVTAASVGGGCSRAGLEGVVPVTGTVTYNGKPVEGAAVSFSPAGEGRSASALTTEDGKFSLTTLEAEDGAFPGSYKIGISKSEVVNPISDAERQKQFHENMGRMPLEEHRSLLPEKFRNPNTSGLTAEVEKSGENNFAFDLAD